MDGCVMCAVCVNKRTDKHIQLLSFIFLLDISSVLFYTKTLHRVEGKEEKGVSKCGLLLHIKYVTVNERV